jgi:hypothetical protein
VPENNYIDGLVNQKLRKLKILPSELCDDATFVRRVYLDVLGILPPPEKTQAFVASTDAKKRELLVDELLKRDEFVEMLAVRFGLSDAARRSKTALLLELESLLHRRNAAGETTVLVVDEAQSLSLELLDRDGLKNEWAAKRAKLLKDKIDVTGFMVWLLENYPASIEAIRSDPGWERRWRG